MISNLKVKLRFFLKSTDSPRKMQLAALHTIIPPLFLHVVASSLLIKDLVKS